MYILYWHVDSFSKSLDPFTPIFGPSSGAYGPPSQVPWTGGSFGGALNSVLRGAQNSLPFQTIQSPSRPSVCT